MSSESDTNLSTDVIFRLLSHHRRRTLLTTLRRHDRPLALADLAEEIATNEYDERLDRIPADEVKRIYMSLYHRHVPKLATHDVVAYDQDQNLVTLAQNADQLIPFLDVAADRD